MAKRALDRAVANAAPWLEALREMLERVSRPTAMTVSKIINDRVTTSAKPFLEVRTFCKRASRATPLGLHSPGQRGKAGWSCREGWIGGRVFIKFKF